MSDTDIPMTQKIVARAPGLDDRTNGLVAFIATGKFNTVSWLVYVSNQEHELLGNPNHIAIVAAGGGTINDF